MIFFHNVRLPRFIEICAIAQPEFSTLLVTSISGREMRSADRDCAKQRYIVKDCRLNEQQFELFNNFFRARKGKLFAFRFRDHADYRAEKQHIASGDGKLVQLTLIKSYSDLIAPYVRRITKPVQDSVKIYLNNQETAAKIEYTLGIVTLGQPLAKDQNAVADFMFDVPVRFASDSFSYAYHDDGSIELSEIELCEVIE